MNIEEGSMDTIAVTYEFVVVIELRERSSRLICGFILEGAV